MRIIFDSFSTYCHHLCNRKIYTILNALRLKTVFFMHYIMEFHIIYTFSCRLLQLQICCCLRQVVIVVLVVGVLGVASCTLQKYFHNFYHDCNSRPKVLHSKSLVFGQLSVWKRHEMVGKEKGLQGGRGEKLFMLTMSSQQISELISSFRAQLFSTITITISSTNTHCTHC